VSFWKSILRRVIVAWLSPVSLLCCTASWIIWSGHTIPGQLSSTIVEGHTAAQNVSRATSVWANASQHQADDVRATLVKINRLTGDLRRDADAARGALDSVHGTAIHVSDTADAATRFLRSSAATSDAATQAIKTNSTAVQTDLVRAGLVMDQVDLALRDPQIRRATQGVADTSTHLAGITGDLQTNLHPILNPPACGTRFCSFRRATIRIIEGGERLGEAGYWSARFLKLLSGK
jgi:hypothetical protein